ncbi:MAG: hypothetical protein ACOH2B_03700 [Burkholderiaceae bacterium]
MPHLDNVFLKLDRANEKAATLAANISAFCCDHPITLDAQLREGRLGVNLVCQMEGMVVPLKEWSLELGEIVYSLRSALDNLIYVCAQIRADPPPRPRDLQFPIIQDSMQYNSAVRNIASQLPEDIADLLEKVQPYQRSKPDVEGSPEHDPLVLLNWISNHDKHRMPVPFLVPPSQIEFSQTCEFVSEADAAANVPPDVVVHAGPLSHGATLLEHRTKNPVTKVSGQFKITAHVAFETHAGTREVSEAIGQLAWYTRIIVDEFSKKIG